MYVAPAYRGTGLARRLLAELEEIARQHGCRAIRLDTSDYLTDAVGLYRAAGYREVPDYNGNPKANLWFERRSTTSRSASRPTTCAGLISSSGSAPPSRRRSAAGPVGGIHHVGSTAVPGLDAKPIVDILVGRRRPRDVAGPASRRSSIWTICTRPICLRRCTGSASRTRAGAPTTCTWFRPTAGASGDELAFRDRLRADREIASRYAALKHELATRLAQDREAYTEAKAAFIHSALHRGSA